MPTREEGEPYFRIDSKEAFEMLKNENTICIDVRGEDEYSIRVSNLNGGIICP